MRIVKVPCGGSYASIACLYRTQVFIVRFVVKNGHHTTRLDKFVSKMKDTILGPIVNVIGRVDTTN